MRHAIGRQDADSEVLVCLVQSLAIVGFAVLYALSPKAFPDTVPFAPVPWTLAAYAGFTAVRLRLALKRRLGRGFVRLSIVIDIVVLMLTIWSFHLQYQAPPALYLKAPTLMYVFILIALRALRLEAELVLLTGGAAALGWLALVAYAGIVDPPPITHDFVTYVTSHALLVGAELDKIVSIVATTLVLALAVHRARRLLVSSVAEEQAASALSRYLAPEVARRIRDGE
ncbi:MAG: adenylate/guanylate cyclase domain-containing protein, partial [Pseudomonadota bacterium]